MKGWSPGSPQQLQEEEEEHLWWSHRNSIPDPRMENGASLCYTRRRPKHYRSAYTCIHTNATVCRKSHLLTTNRCENKSLQPCWPVYTQQFIRLRRNKTSRTCSLIDSKVVTTIRPIPNTCSGVVDLKRWVQKVAQFSRRRIFPTRRLKNIFRQAKI